jgi:hypothetical protein
MSSISTNEYKVAKRNLKIDLSENELRATANPINAVDVHINNLCPHCGESYYMENYSTTTAMYYPPIYKNGVNINPDRNTTTTYCTCLNCGKEFSFER